jgi:hypothetical protein
MRTIFLTIAVAALSVAVAAPVEAATKHRHHPPPQAAPAAPVVSPPVFGGPYAPAYARPGGCYTDEGGGRIAPCDHGGGLGGGGGGM